MRRPVTRALMALTGVAMLFVYAVAALAVYRLLLLLWRQRPDPATTALVVVGLSLTFGYASYRLGTARILSALDATELSRARAAGFYERIDALADEMDVDARRPALDALHPRRRGGTLTRLLASHPPIDERIDRLADQAEERRGQAVRIPVE